MNKLSKIEQDTIIKFNEFVRNNDVSNEFLVQLIEQAGDYLNLQTIPNYAKRENMSYNGVKKGRYIRNIFNVKFVIENT